MPIDTLPIVGQLYKVTTWRLLVDIVCTCGKEFTVHLVQAQLAQCEHCGTAFRCVGMKWDPEQNGMNAGFKIWAGRALPDGDPDQPATTLVN